MSLNLPTDRDYTKRMKHSIQQGIPIPRPRLKGTKYPFESMNVGDSFSITGGRLEQVRIYTAANKWAERRGVNWRFTTRVVNKMVRIWRLEDGEKSAINHGRNNLNDPTVIMRVPTAIKIQVLDLIAEHRKNFQRP